jgi:hypothetical protein
MEHLQYNVLNIIIIKVKDIFWYIKQVIFLNLFLPLQMTIINLLKLTLFSKKLIKMLYIVK